MGYYYTPSEKDDERKIGFSMKGHGTQGLFQRPAICS